MKAVQVVAFGRAQDVVKLNEVPDVGSPGPNEVVVAVEAVEGTDAAIQRGGTPERSPLNRIPVTSKRPLCVALQEFWI